MQSLINATIIEVGRVVLGKEHQIKLALACLLANGHLLIEDLPGMAKTTLSKALANVLELRYSRIQFTSDLLPADILGVSIYQQERGQFNFQEGPIFSQLVLADEINRATPKSQSALLEAMEERQITIDGETRPLPKPFFVIATQNPITQTGTFPLPESQLDRFLMRIRLGYPSVEAELKLLRGTDSRLLLSKLNVVLPFTDLQRIQDAVIKIYASDSLLAYVQRIIAFSRDSNTFLCGISPRGGLGIVHAAKAWALIAGRDHLIPEDIQAVLPAVVDHRLQISADQVRNENEGAAQLLLENIDVIPDSNA